MDKKVEEEVERISKKVIVKTLALAAAFVWGLNTLLYEFRKRTGKSERKK